MFLIRMPWMKRCEAALPVPCWCVRENILPKEKARVSLRVGSSRKSDESAANEWLHQRRGT